ncbi:hypothetical protein CHLRE_08g364850v5 [Chlamydomonas reinhardtii]|uniref:Uncharacterized protein n=1 Tax=Chlamydomonas reinhardtii TaxID=3055 RepID=A0A2K3DGS2_CHLRE|nr:uncharacterized protein CHLRE_08g364850v5 [Chlamydomonas reinhardtii]PNW79731.1 hypothetical protein CHLRE_08g364850v5 [Chlamydomonas reinhardtii]
MRNSNTDVTYSLLGSRLVQVIVAGLLVFGLLAFGGWRASTVTQQSSGARAAWLPGASDTDEGRIRQRATAAVLGALVADAATMALHWIYDTDKIQDLLSRHGRRDEPAFFEPPSCPYYEYDSGSFSPYGDELLPVLQYMADQERGTLDGPGFAEYLAAYYRNYTGRLNKSSKAMMEAVLQGGRKWPECGDPRDTQANNFVKVIPIVARYAGRPGLAQAVDAAVRAQQNNGEAVELAWAAALVLEQVVLGHSIAAAVEWVAGGAPGSHRPVSKSVLQALGSVVEHRRSNTALRDLLYAPGSASKPGDWGPSCANPGALKGALLGAVQASGQPARGSRAKAASGSSSSSSSSSSSGGGKAGSGAFARGVRANLLLGGDNCSRGVLLGALLAAEGGLVSIPSAWRAKTRGLAQAEVLTEQLLDSRGGSVAAAA